MSDHRIELTLKAGEEDRIAAAVLEKLTHDIFDPMLDAANEAQRAALKWREIAHRLAFHGSFSGAGIAAFDAFVEAAADEGFVIGSGAGDE